MPTNKIDTLVMIIADRNCGKSNQIRSVFEEIELRHFHGGYPSSNMIGRKYHVEPDVDLFVRLSSWHEMKQGYRVVKREIGNGYLDIRRRYKVLVAAQVSATRKLMGGEDLFIRLFSDFEIRRGLAVWLSPNKPGVKPFKVSRKLAKFMSTRRHVSALSIDSAVAHPSANPQLNSINSRLLSDFLFRI
jgi:hypothetical protein